MDTPVDPPLDETFVEKIITTEGGEITSGNNVLKLTFSPGSTSQDTTISISIEDVTNIPTSIFGSLEGESYKLEPSGMEFNEPVKVQINVFDFFDEFDPARSTILHWNQSTNQYESVTAELNEGTGNATFTINSFSYLTPGGAKDVDRPDSFSSWRVFNIKWGLPVVHWYEDEPEGSAGQDYYRPDTYQKAFDQWASISGITGLTFKQVNEKAEAQIILKEFFADRPDCPEYSLADEEYGAICIDSDAALGDEILDQSNQIQIRFDSNDISNSEHENMMMGVLLHKIGHAIGIAHPAFIQSGQCIDGVMVSGAPFFNELQECDIPPAEHHYGFKEVTSPTGRVWMDRNLGASRVATSMDDELAYGDYYQWGRGADGHQKLNSDTTSTLSSTDQPGHDDFIIGTLAPHDWRSPKNDNLWQGLDGINNPCPSGFRIPTATELDAERKSWNSNDPAGAFASPLKLPRPGIRNYHTTELQEPRDRAQYWSSSVDGTDAGYLVFNDFGAVIVFSNRAPGTSVRCIKD